MFPCSGLLLVMATMLAVDVALAHESLALPYNEEFPDRCVFYLNGERKTLLRGQKMWRADGCGAVDVACRTTIEGEHTLYSPREICDLITLPPGCRATEPPPGVPMVAGRTYFDCAGGADKASLKEERRPKILDLPTSQGSPGHCDFRYKGKFQLLSPGESLRYSGGCGTVTCLVSIEGGYFLHNPDGLCSKLGIPPNCREREWSPYSIAGRKKFDCQ